MGMNSTESKGLRGTIIDFCLYKNNIKYLFHYFVKGLQFHIDLIVINLSRKTLSSYETLQKAAGDCNEL